MKKKTELDRTAEKGRYCKAAEKDGGQ